MYSITKHIQCTSLVNIVKKKKTLSLVPLFYLQFPWIIGRVLVFVFFLFFFSCNYLSLPMRKLFLEMLNTEYFQFLVKKKNMDFTSNYTLGMIT